MRRLQIGFVLLIVIAGCKSGMKLTHFGQSVPGTSSISSEAPLSDDRSDETTDTGVVQVAATDEPPNQKVSLFTQMTPEPGEQTVAGTEIVAIVNGTPIFAAEILDRYAPQLAMAQQKLSPAQLKQFRDSLIQKDLKHYIQRHLLVEAVKSKLKPAEVDKLNKQLDSYFEREIESIKEKLHVDTRIELDQKLQEQGTNLANLKNQFVSQQLAMEYLRSKAAKPSNFSREELLAYYQDHREEFAVPGRVKWQQILVSYAKHGGQSQAFQVVEKVIDELRQGIPFQDVARHYSDGPTAHDGGYWDWTQAGSLANEKIEEALFELPVGEISQVFSDEDHYELIRVTERRDSSYRSFESVQNEIKTKLEQEAQVQTRQEAIDELYKSAVMETRFDLEGNGTEN